MTTGLEQANLQDKMILGFQDFAVRVVQYLQAQVIESIKTHWNLDGVFDTLLVLDSSVPNTVHVTGTSLATDGEGHIMDITQAIGGQQMFFENNLGVLYYVGLTHTQIPNEITINPRTGRPQYRGMIDQIGRSGAPTSITDLGNGTIKIVVDAVVESGTSYAGRTFQVWMNVPAQEATTAAIAIESQTCQWDGTHNYIITAGNLGQNSVDTNAADYTVCLEGPIITKTINLQFTPTVCFLGTVLGVGTGNTPVSFDNSNQRVLKTFEDASQILLTTYKWITAGTVQEGFQQVVDVLASTAIPSGVSRLGVDMTAFTPRKPMAAQPAGGLGNVTDGTFNPSTDTLQTFLLKGPDTQLRRARSVTATFGDQGSGFIGDYSNTEFATQFQTSGLYYLKRVANPANKYMIAPGGDTGANQSFVLGEVSDPSGADPSVRTWITTSGPVTGSAIYRGTFMRCYLDADPTSTGSIALGDPVNGNNVIMEDFGIRAGYVGLLDHNVLRLQPYHLRNGIIKPQTGDNAPNSESLGIAHATGGNNLSFGTIENVVIYGPDASSLSATAAFRSDLTGGPTIGDEIITPVTFRNCIFWVNSADVPAVFLNGTHKYTFDNCVFLATPGVYSPVISARNGADIHLRNCYIFTAEGQALYAPGCTGTVEDCIFVADGQDLSSPHTLADPKFIWATPANGGKFTWKNNLVLIGSAAARPTGAQNPLIRFGDDGQTGIMHVDGLYVFYTTGSGINIHNGPTLYCVGNNVASCTFNNIQVDYNGLTRTTSNDSLAAGFPAMIAMNKTRGHRFKVGNLGSPVGVLSTYQVAFISPVTKHSDVHIDFGAGGDGSNRWQYGLYLDDCVQLDGVMLEARGGGGGYGAVSCTDGVVRLGNSCQLLNCSNGPASPNAASAGPGSLAFIYVPSSSDSVAIRGLYLRWMGQNHCPVIYGDECNRLFVNDFRIECTQLTDGNPVINLTGHTSTLNGRQHMIMNGFIYWNNTTYSAINFDASDGVSSTIIGRASNSGVTSTFVTTTFSGSNTSLVCNLLSYT